MAWSAPCRTNRPCRSRKRWREARGGLVFFGGCEVDGDECPGPFGTALAHIGTHGVAEDRGDLPALERGGLCWSFKSDEWEGFDDVVERVLEGVGVDSPRFLRVGCGRVGDGVSQGGSAQ